MAFLVIAYPKLDKKDLDWIQKYREENDPRYFDVVDPHITLLFAIHDVDKEMFVAEVKKQIAGIEPFNFVIRVVTINQNDDGKYYHEFLVPDEGYSNVVKLHDRLYSGIFKDHLRLDIDFIPHIGIGNSDDALVSKKRAEELNAAGVNIEGRVDSIAIIEYADSKVKTIETVKL